MVCGSLGQSEAERLAKDPMYRLEHGVKDEQKAKESVPQIEQLQVHLICVCDQCMRELTSPPPPPCLSHLQKLQEGKKDDFALNQMLRKRFRVSVICVSKYLE